MNLDLDKVEDNQDVFSTEINDMFCMATKSGQGSISVAVYHLSSNAIRDFYFEEFVAVEGKRIHFVGLGNVFRDFVLNNDIKKFPVASFWIYVYIDGDRIVNKPLKVFAHFGKKHLKASEYVDRHFMNDCKSMIIPMLDGKCIQQRVYLYLKNNFRLNYFTQGYKDRYILDKIIHKNSQLGSLDFLEFFNVSTAVNADYRFFDFYVRDKDSLEIDFERLQIMIDDEFTGKGFVFMNSFGLKEFVFIPGEVSYSTKKDSTQVVGNGRINEIDIIDESRFSIKVENAPDWLVKNATALLESRCVRVLDDVYEYNDDNDMIFSDPNVFVAEFSGNLDQKPGELSNFTITFQRIDI